MIYDAIIIGGGAAGLFCAIEAGKRGRRTLVIEHNSECGRKIIISGGGRCNFTNKHVTAENFISKNSHFCKSALAGFTPQDFIDLVRRHDIPYYEKTLGQLFCRENSRRILDMLLAECARSKVEIRTSCSVKTVEKNDGFEVVTSEGDLRSRNLVVATGGLSFAKIGATDLGFQIARKFGLKIEETRPSLVGLRLKNQAGYAALSGLSVEAVASAGKQAFRESILFTHKGMSGPAVIQISNYWSKDKPVDIDLLPSDDPPEILEQNIHRQITLTNFLASILPRRLAEALVAKNFTDKPLDQLSKVEITRIADLLGKWQLEFSETEGYDRAEVTLGGVSTSELSSKTMESKKIAGLYFIGEVVDVTGWLGGYNFQWAWSSAHAAGAAI